MKIIDKESFIQKTNEIQDLVFDFVSHYGADEMDVGQRFECRHFSGFIQIEAVCECCKRATYITVSVPRSSFQRGIRLVGTFDVRDPDEIETVRWEWIVPARNGSELTKRVA